MRKPFYKKSHRAWYCEIDRRQIRLGSDKEAAIQEYHSLMAGQQPVTAKTTVAALVDQFLQWTETHRAPSTYEWYLRRCQSFIDFVGPKLRVPDVRPIHVSRWLERCYKDGSDTYKNGVCRAVSRAFNWAARQGLIAANPLSGMERPAAESREAYLTPDQWQRLIAEVKPSDPFHDLLCFLRETGCRPQEARILTADHWDRANQRFVLERKQSKGKKSRRVIRLNDRATEIVTRLAPKRPEGEIFINTRGRPWNKDTIICRFAALEKRLGFECFAYILRHSWCTDALLRGVDPMTVAIFLGHKDATMVMRVYSHLVQQDEFLRTKLKQATGEDVA